MRDAVRTVKCQLNTLWNIRIESGARDRKVENENVWRVYQMSVHVCKV